MEKNSEMDKFFLTITTVADGKENEISREAEGILSHGLVQIKYREENAEVSLRLENGTVFIDRRGDYVLSLQLKKNERTKGELGINGSVGEIETQTARIAYSLTENSFMLSLHYSLLVGTEPQDMRIRLFAKKL